MIIKRLYREDVCMNAKKWLALGLQIVTFLYALFAVIYGSLLCATEPCPSLDFHNPSDALATHQEIIYFSIPFIIIGVVLILVLTVYYVSRFTNQNVLKFSIYGIVVTVIGALLTFGFIGIAIYLQEISLIIAIIPAIFLAIYGIFLIVKRKKSKNIQQTQSYSD